MGVCLVQAWAASCSADRVLLHCAGLKSTQLAVEGVSVHVYTTTMAPWSSAREICKTRGLDLASVWSEPAADELSQLATSAMVAAGYSGQGVVYWLGGLKEVSGPWRWQDSTPFIYSRPITARSSASNAAQCLAGITGFDSSQMWGGFHCVQRTAQFVCAPPRK